MSETQNKKQKSTKVKLLKLTAIFVVVLLTLFILYRLKLKRQFEAELQAIRDAGYPATCEELDKWYSIPPGQENAAELILEAINYFNSPMDSNVLPFIGEAKNPSLEESLDEQTITHIKKYLAQNKEAFEKLHKAVRIEHSRYPMDLTQGMGVLMPHLVVLPKTSRNLQLEVLYHTETGQTDKAIKSTESILHLARSLSKEPVLSSYLIAISIQALAVDATEQLLNKTELNDSQLIHLIEAFAEAKQQLSLSSVIAGERCMFVHLYKNSSVPLFLPIPNPEAGFFFLYKLSGLKDTDALIHLHIWNQSIQACEQAPQLRYKVFQASEKEIDDLPAIHMFVKLIHPVLTKTAKHDQRRIANLRMAGIAFAIQRYRLANNKRPDELNNLVPQFIHNVSLDPFDGNDLRYKKLQKGFVIYSVGEDLADDGGKAKPDNSYSGTYDYIFQVLK